MTEALDSQYPDRVQDPEKAHAMAIAADAVRKEAAGHRKRAQRLAIESQTQQESVITIASQKDQEADETELDAGKLYDVRFFLQQRRDESDNSETSSELADFRKEVLQAALAASEQIELESFIGEQIELDAIENLLRCGDLSAVERALDIIENPRSEFFTRYPDGESHKQLAYRDLAIAAYEGGLIQEAKAIETLVKYYKTPLLFVKAKVLEEAVPELLGEVEDIGREEYKAELKSIASRYIAKGKLEPARMIVGMLQEKRKFALLAEMVEAGDETYISTARETALQLRKELGAREIPHGYSAEEYQIRALLRLFDAGDKQSLELAFSVANSVERPWTRIQLLGWLGSEINKRNKA